MPRKKTILQSNHPYHITARCINYEWFKVPLPHVWTIMENYLFFLHHSFGFRIHSFVLMDNHFHLLVSTPEANLSEGMNYFMRETSRCITMLAGRINQTYGAPYHWCIVDSYHYLLNAYKYVYRNPIEAKLTSRCEDYSYSTLPGLLGYQKLNIPLAEDTILFQPTVSNDELQWLNFASEEDTLEIKKALKKQYFRYERDTSYRRPRLSETFVY